MRFKTLTYGDQFVDINLLAVGISITEVPFLFTANHTIDSIIEAYVFNHHYMGLDTTKEWIKYAKTCKLTELEVTICL